MMRIAERIAQARGAPGACHRRCGRAGSVADAREPGRDRVRWRRCRYSGRSSEWTRRRSRPRRSGSAPIRSPSFLTRTAARCLRRAIRMTRAPPRRDRSRRGRPCRSTRSSSGRWLRLSWKISNSRTVRRAKAADGRIERPRCRVAPTTAIETGASALDSINRSWATMLRLLDHQCKTIPKESLHLPGPDFVDRVFGRLGSPGARAGQPAVDVRHRAAGRDRVSSRSCRSTRASSTRPERRSRRTRRTSTPRTSSSSPSKAAAMPWRRRSG